MPAHCRENYQDYEGICDRSLHDSEKKTPRKSRLGCGKTRAEQENRQQVHKTACYRCQECRGKRGTGTDPACQVREGEEADEDSRGLRFPVIKTDRNFIILFFIMCGR